MIKVTPIVILWALLYGAAWGQQSVQSWNGLRVLVSTDTDVQKLLGNAFDETLRIFDTRNERVTFWFSGDRCAATGADLWNVPKGTITTILVAPKEAIDAQKVIADYKEAFQKRIDAEMPSRSLYWNGDGSVEIETQTETDNRETLIYTALRATAAQKKALRCK